MIYLIVFLLPIFLGFIFSRGNVNRVGQITTTLTLGTVFALACYLALPVLAFNFTGILWFILLEVALSGLMVGICSDEFEGLNTPVYVPVIGVIFLFLVGYNLTSSTMFRNDEYHALIGNVKEGNFQSDVEIIDQAQVAIIDAEIATRRGEELLGNDPGIGSRCHLGEMTRQSIAGKLYYVAVLEHSSDIKAWQNDTTPGYVIISATNPMDGKLVVGMNFKYLPTGVFGNDLERHIWSTYPSIGLTDYTFLLDDELRPWWVVTVYDHTIGNSGSKATGAIIVNPTTGEMIKASLSEMATKYAWADRVQPKDMVVDNLDFWGEYSKGWWNTTIFGRGEDILQTTPGIELIYSKNGRSMWYAGIQARGRDSGTTGFVMVDTITGEATFYKIAGSTETGGKHTIEGKVQQYGYEATWPILYNIHGHASYISTLKDKAGNYKMIGIASVQNRGIVAVGNNLSDALRAYMDTLNNLGGVALDPSMAPKTIKGRVIRVANEIVDGRTNYLLLLAEYPTHAFTLNSSVNRTIPFVRVSDQVTVTYSGELTDYNPVTAFSIDDFVLEASPADQTVTAAIKKTLTESTSVIENANLEKRFNALTAEQKRHLLEK